MTWNNIPQELKELSQWLLCGQDKAPKTIKDGRLVFASVTNPDTWLPFETACAAATSRGLNIGFVLSENDPYSCIDLDVKDAENCPDHPEKWTDQEQYDLFYRIMKNFASYTETSVSGKGLHIWVRGSIGEGKRRGNVEIYSQSRFIITTGNIVQNLPIIEQQEMLSKLPLLKI